MRHKNNIRTTILTRLILAAAVLIICSPAAYADPEDESDASISVPGIRSLTLEQNSLHYEPNINQMLEGWTEQQVLITRVSANVNWVLNIRGSDEFWEGPWDKPVGDLYWKYGGGSGSSVSRSDAGYQPLGTQPTEVASGGPCNQRTFPIHFRVKLDLETDVPGEYYYTYVVIELTMP
jgi:hypothetical protein